MPRNYEFYQEIAGCVRENARKMKSEAIMLRDLENMKQSGKYSAEYIGKAIEPEIRTRKQKLEDLTIAANQEVKRLCDEYRKELLDEDSLKGTELTDDARLLGSGVALRERDLSAMLERNKGNRTMEQLILRYAEDNKIDLGVKYAGNDASVKLIDSVPYVSGVALKWYQDDDLVEKFVGEGSDMESAFSDECQK